MDSTAVFGVEGAARAGAGAGAAHEMEARDFAIASAASNETERGRREDRSSAACRSEVNAYLASYLLTVSVAITIILSHARSSHLSNIDRIKEMGNILKPAKAGRAQGVNTEGAVVHMLCIPEQGEEMGRAGRVLLWAWRLCCRGTAVVTTVPAAATAAGASPLPPSHGSVPACAVLAV